MKLNKKMTTYPMRMALIDCALDIPKHNRPLFCAQYKSIDGKNTINAVYESDGVCRWVFAEHKEAIAYIKMLDRDEAAQHFDVDCAEGASFESDYTWGYYD